MEPAYRQTTAVLLLLLAPVWATAVGPGIRRLGDTVIVVQDTAQPVVLQAMMNATVSDLEFQVPDFTLVPAAWTYITEAAPFMLMRNFMISSAAQPPTVLDFQYLAHRVVLGDGATAVNYTFKGVTLANIRKSNNFGIDFFTNSQGSTVMFEDVIVLETACSAAPADALAAAVSQPALAGHPRNSAKLLPNTCIQLPEGRRCFENSLHFNSHAQQASAQEGGYTFVQRNTTRVCLSYVDPECLRTNGDNLELCWQQQALRIQPWLQPASQQTKQLSPGAIAGIAVAAGVVAAAAAGLLLWWCRRRADQHKLPAAEDTLKAAEMHYDYSLNSKQSGSMYSGGPPSVVSIPRSSSVAGGVQLGVLLGAGSFGRVYRGKWHSSDVAIKVMSCSPIELPRVLKEAEIMIGLEHENIVRALHCMVVDKQPAAAAMQSSAMSAERKASIGDSWQQRHSGQSHSSSPVTTSASNSAAQAQHAAAGAGAVGPPCGMNSQVQDNHSRLCSAGVSTAVYQNPTGSQPEWLRSKAQQQQQQQQQGPPEQQEQQQQQQQQPPSIGRFGSGSFCKLNRLGRKSSSDIAAAVKGLLQGSKPAPAAAAAEGATDTSTAQTSSEDRDAVQQQQQQQQQKQQHITQQQQQQRHKRAPKHIELPPSGQDELLTYPDSSAAEHTPEKGEVEVWLVMELCSCGTLKEAYSRPRDTMAMARLVSRLLEVARGMSFLHANNVLHGDLKAANVLLKSTIYSSFGHVSKISDFGLASRLLDGATHRSTQTTGTISHSAPEVLTTGRMSTAADVYSFGIMMWELFTACSAFKGHFGNVVQRVVAGERPPLPEEAPEEYNLLMTSCWSADPRARPSFQQVAECLELMLESFSNLTQELIPLEEAELQAAAGENTAAPAAAVGNGNIAAAAASAAQAGAQQQQRLRTLKESSHVQDL